MSTEENITPSIALEWAKVIFVLIVLGLGIFALFYAISDDITLLTDKFDVLFGWFLGLLTTAAVVLGLNSPAKPKTNSK